MQRIQEIEQKNGFELPASYKNYWRVLNYLYYWK
ncbi:SMI1/KNR4 family protein [Capnocytophaga stomatis]